MPVWMSPSKRRPCASSTRAARSAGRRRCRATPRISREPFTTGPGVWSESASRPGPCRNGCSAAWLLQEKALAVDNDIRGLLRNFGLKVGPIGASRFETRTRELVDGMPELAEIIDPLLEARRKLRELFAVLHRKLLAIVRDDTVCRR